MAPWRERTTPSSSNGGATLTEAFQSDPVMVWCDPDGPPIHCMWRAPM